MFFVFDSGRFETKCTSFSLAGKHYEYLGIESESIGSFAVRDHLLIWRVICDNFVFSERAEERLRDHIFKFEKKLEDLHKEVDLFRRKDVCYSSNSILFEKHLFLRTIGVE